MTMYLLFDVDGVFNVWPRPKDLEAWQVKSGWTDSETDIIGGYSITWSTELVEWVNTMTARDDVVPMWLTTWCELAQVELGPRLGLRDSHTWQTLGSVNDRKSARGWWKAEHVRDLMGTTVSPDDIVVWIDDDHSIYSNVTLGLLNEHVNIHAIEPLSSVGLKKATVEYIESLL